jgi:ribonucleoside-diphosphate reductase alpha chain
MILRNNLFNIISMKVKTRNGKLEEVKFDLITEKIDYLSKKNRKLNVDPVFVAQTICGLIYDGITTKELDEFSAGHCATFFKEDPDYLILASRIAINNHHKNTNSNFLDVMKILNKKGIVSDFIIEVASENEEFINSIIDYEKDYLITYFGFKSLEKSYLLKIDNNVVERPQHLFMRVALAIHEHDVDMVKKVYESLSNKYYTHATPTLFNAGTNFQQLSSCFLIGTEDSVEGLYKTASDIALISKWAGGIGVHISNVRASNSYINKTGGVSNGIMPLLKVYNDISRHINQSGKRNGSFAVYIEPWHSDIYDFLDAKKNNGAEEMRARDLFYGLWVPDLFMKRVESNGLWSLMCPNECKGLTDVYGEEFEKLYTHYESEKMYRKQINAIELWEKIINAQIETGSPYILYKDACNQKSNQKHYGIIKSSNLCTEIIEYSDSKETAVCNLASLCLPSFVTGDKFDFELLGEKTQELVHNLNNIIDINSYPTNESRNSNFKHRPIGIGVQGLADVFMILKMPYDCEDAMKLNRQIFECMYYNSLVMSNKLAIKHGSYTTFEGSPTSQGILQFDLWKVKPEFYSEDVWDELKSEIKCKGLRNSLLIAPMPTASTAQIMGNNESFEPYTSNMYSRSVLSGNFIIINNHLVNELRTRKLYNKDIVEKIMLNKGSVQNLDLPQDIKNIYKTSWELSQKNILKMAVERGPYICQSQSLNLFVNPPTPAVIHSIHFYGWKNGLKTGSYYIRTKSVLEAQNFTTDYKKEKHNKEEKECIMCSA